MRQAMAARSLFTLLILPLFALLWHPAPVAAQQRKPLVIDLVQVGFGASNAVAEFKDGFWTPVYVDLRAWEEGAIPAGELVVESVDSDDIRSRYKVPFRGLNPTETMTLMSYTRPGHHDITVSVEVDK